MSRLLSDEEMRPVVRPHRAIIDYPLSIRDAEKAVAEAQDAKTAREVCREVAEWQMEDCDNPTHRQRGNYRTHCTLCQQILVSALRDGNPPQKGQ